MELIVLEPKKRVGTGSALRFPGDSVKGLPSVVCSTDSAMALFQQGEPTLVVEERRIDLVIASCSESA